MANNMHPLCEEWMEYYKTLEAIRRTGVVNMWGSASVLRECFPGMSEQKATDVLLSWIANYDALNKRFGWQK